MRRLLPLLAPLLALFASLALPARGDDILVFAAASLKTALDQVAADHGAQSGDRVAVSYAGSSQLARQIQLGAPVDVFISSNTAWMDLLEAEGALAPGTRSDLLGNRLVLIAHDPDAAPVDLTDPDGLAARLGDGHLAMALVDAVPAGIYGREALESLGLWASVEGRVAQSDNARSALALVAAGAAPFGLVYATDAHADPRVKVVATIPETAHSPIVYPVAAIAGHDRAAVRGFLAYLHSEPARAVFEAQGFIWLGG